MPIVVVHIRRGLTNTDTKRALIKNLTNAVCESVPGVVPDVVSIQLVENDAENIGKAGRPMADIIREKQQQK